MKYEQTIIKYLYGISATAIILFTVFPFIYMFLISCLPSPESLITPSSFGLSFHNYKAIFSIRSLHFTDYLKNSLLISVVSSLICVIIAMFCAYALTRMRVPFRALLLIGILSLSLFPQISFVSYLFKLMSFLGVINTYHALWPVYSTWALPMTIWIIAGYLRQIPIELDEAALTDGCSRMKMILNILLPVCIPGIFTAFILAFIFIMNDLLFALILTTDHTARTIPVGIALFHGLHGETPWGYIMATAAITSIPIIFTIYFFQRYIIGGLTQGALKQ